MDWQSCERCRNETKGINENPCFDCGIEAKNYEPKTYADRIRNMTDEELAVYTCEIQQLAIDRNKADRVEDALQWLQTEVKEGESNARNGNFK